VSDPVYKDEPELDQLEADDSPFVVPRPAELTTRAPERRGYMLLQWLLACFCRFLD
jgi:hypothetical protein